MPVNLMDIEALAQRLARVEDRLATLAKPPHYKTDPSMEALAVERAANSELNALLRTARDAQDTLRKENVELRADRVKLQGENEVLRGELKRLKGERADYPDAAPEDMSIDPTHDARELPEAAPDRAGWHGTWVADNPVSQHLKQGDRVRFVEGARSFGGVPVGLDGVVQMVGLRKRDGHAYTVRVGLKADADAGYWVRPEDIAEVLA